MITVDPERIAWNTGGKWLQLEAWDGDQFLSRRISAVASCSEQRLELTIEKFGGKKGSITLFDAARPANQPLRDRSRRQVFAEVFHGFLRHHFAGWRVQELSSEPNLQHSLSPAYPRAFLKRGTSGWAAIAAPPDSDIDGVLTFGLIWLDYLRRREPGIAVEGLAVWMPVGGERTTCLRMRWLDPSAARWMAFVYKLDGHAAPVDLADCGNLNTSIEPPREYTSNGALEPEALLEEQVRNEIQQIDAALLARPVYGQVPAFAGGGRGILDLLACDQYGRLSVLELKASESVHLPLQALDYWMRVRAHLESGDFSRFGYFPGKPLQSTPPRLLLVAPALDFHPSNERVIRFFHPEIEAERIGVNGLLHGSLKVLFRQPRG